MVKKQKLGSPVCKFEGYLIRFLITKHHKRGGVGVYKGKKLISPKYLANVEEAKQFILNI
jgi:hypothetical protein